MKCLILAFLAFVLPFTLHAKGKDDPLKYDIALATVAKSPDVTLVSISVYVGKPKTATVDYLKKAAVHGVIFRGVQGGSLGGFRPLVPSAGAAQQHGEFFDSFFQEGGQYLSYANIIDDYRKTVKVGKKEYRVTATVSVSTQLLRKLLREAGIARGMLDGF